MMITTSKALRTCRVLGGGSRSDADEIFFSLDNQSWLCSPKQWECIPWGDQFSKIVQNHRAATHLLIFVSKISYLLLSQIAKRPPCRYAPLFFIKKMRSFKKNFQNHRAATCPFTVVPKKHNKILQISSKKHHAATYLFINKTWENTPSTIIWKNTRKNLKILWKTFHKNSKKSFKNHLKPTVPLRKIKPFVTHSIKNYRTAVQPSFFSIQKRQKDTVPLHKITKPQKSTVPLCGFRFLCKNP